MAFVEQRHLEGLLKKTFGEEFVYKGDFKYEDSKRDMVLLLGKEHFFEIDGEEEIEYLEELPNPKSYLTLDSAEEIPGQNEKFVIHVGARPAIHLEGEELDVVEAVVVLNSLIRDAWQKACESAFILGREVYQFHAIVRKVNRRKKTQDRILVVSNQWIYNMEMFGEEGPQEEFKWSLPIGSLLRVAAGKDDSKLGEFPATIHFDLVVAKQLLAQNAYKDRKLGTKGSSVNDKHQLLFISQYARDRCTMALVALYYSQSKKRLAFTRGNEATGIRRSQLGVIKKEGTLEKYTRGIVGVGKHPRFVQIKSTGYIAWGKEKGKLKFDESIVGVRDEGAALEQFKLSDEEKAQFFCVLTSGKSLYFLCPSVQEKKDWVACINSIVETASYK
mmetsp:Transcript_3198/g.4907  ORF Transcript_3198/g.4907 Transcript_3198/m.4907 type:complete len:388 (-) Transcript_3198:158-1321(-)|eukprot:jgi/Bigna1/74713/fgenesh1_pg.30_\